MLSGYDRRFNLEIETLIQLCHTSAMTPRTVSVLLLIQYEEWNQLMELETDPMAYREDETEKFRHDYLITKFLSKSPNVPIWNAETRRQKAVADFYISERQCGATNLRLERYLGLFPGATREADWCYQTIILPVRRRLSKILGALSSRDMDDVVSDQRVGPGATFSIKGVGWVTSDKYDRNVCLTPSLVPYCRAIMGDNWANHVEKLVIKGNRFAAVPKNAKTDRGICIEPGLNVRVQLGIGTLIRRRLRSSGLDLSIQADINRHYVQRAQAEGLATIDLKRSSDSFAEVLVPLLFDERWASLLYLPRCAYTQIDKNWVRLNKFSSMGNGYTFELQSLLFYAIIREFGIETSNPCVFGDDLIVAKADYDCITSVLEFFGFEINSKKSFKNGLFYESCGVDVFNKINVRPLFAKADCDELTGLPTGIPYGVQLANALRRYAYQINPIGCDARFRSTWRHLVKRVPRSWRLPIPLICGDCGLAMSIQESKAYGALIRPTDQTEGFLTRVILFDVIKVRKKSYGRLLYALDRKPNDSPFKIGTINPTVETRGFEPRRGYLGVPQTKLTLIRWDEDLTWY